ncbi:MAG: archaellin/type IV pilin N-terminal domain-containing protein [Candidatus Bathyarchaeia archaeon]
MRKTMNHRKAVSPIIAVLLMVIIAIAVAAAVYTNLVGIIGTTGESAKGRKKTTLQIDSVEKYNSTHLKIYVRNTGFFDVDSIDLFFEFENGTVLTGTISSTLSAGSSTSGWINYSGKTLTSDNAFVAKAVGSDGSSTSYPWIAP